MESGAGVIAALPGHAEIRSRVARGRTLKICLDEAVSFSATEAAARTLRDALPSDLKAIVSAKGGRPVLKVLQLVSDSEAASVRPALECLVAEFRQAAKALVDHLKAGSSPVDDVDGDCLASVRYREATWDLYPHGEHCRFENAASGEVVEANIYAPDLVDPYFLLEFATTSGRHEAVVDACVEGFHDMCRLLDLAGIGSG